jgi:hypothetical protein
LRDLEAELEQFAVDARRSPKRVLPVHPANRCPPKAEVVSSNLAGSARFRP